DRQRQVPRLMQLDRIGGLPEAGSPGTTARSGAASSSSPGGCSSHGHDAWASGVYAQDLAAQGSLTTPPASAVASLEQETALKNKEWVSDMSRELEVMRHVIQKEMSEMRRLWMEKKEALAPLLSKRARPARLRRDCWTQPMSSSSLSLETLEAQGLEPSSYLEWRIQGIEAGVAPAQHTFELPEHPEVSFCCTFGPWAENRESSDSPRSPWCFELGLKSISDEASSAQGLWRVSLSVEQLTNELTNQQSQDEQEEEEEYDLPEDWGEVLGELSGYRLRLGKTAPCLFARPDFSSTLLCRAHLQYRGRIRQVVERNK
ncbi:unnamed protein product, partial [Polarella glacialis]